MTAFNEDMRVKIPATIQFLRLGYEYQSLREADIDFNTKIFINRFKPALEKINGREFSFDEIKEILLEINSVIKNNDLGKEFYNWLINPLDRVKIFDAEDWDNNDFAVVDELPFSVIEGTEQGSFRPDINILINGIPLGFLEVKKPNNEGGIQKEFDRMINKRLVNPDYKKFFNMIQFVAFSNNMEYEDADDAEDVKAGSFYTTPNGTNTSFSFFREDDENYYMDYPYLEITEEIMRYIIKDCGYNAVEYDTEEFKENLKTGTPCNSFVTSVFDRERFVYFLHYGMMFLNGKIPEKHIMRYPQFFATRKIIERLEKGGKGGIIWHTQGSGKTGLAAFANRVIRDYYARQNINTRFFFIVDRLDLLRQASTEFKVRGLNVINCKDKEEFMKEIDKPLSRSIADMVSDNFIYYHFRGTCLTLKEFDEIYGFNFVKEPQDFNEDYLINFMEYIYNFIVSLDNRFLFLDMGKDFYIQQIIRVVDRIGYIFAVENGLTIFIPRDNNAIAVAESELIPDSLSYKVLEYNHHSLKGDIEAKREILVKLASVLESQDKKLNSINQTFKSDLFQLLNSCNIRHNNKDESSKQYKKYIAEISNAELEHTYDEIYQMCLLAFMQLEHVDRKDWLDRVKNDLVNKK